MSLRLAVRCTAVPALVGFLLLPVLGPATAGEPRPVSQPAQFALVRDTGMPTTDDPSRTLVTADASVWPVDDATTEVSVAVSLGAAPAPGTAPDLRIGVGRPTADGCEVVSSWAVPTDAPEYADPLVPAGVVGIAVTHEVPAGQVPSTACLVVALVDPAAVGGTDLDRWSSAVSRVAPMRAAPAQARIVDVTHTRLPARTWSWVEVRLRIRYHGVSSVRVDGRGEDVRVEPVVLTREFAKGERVVVGLPVRLCAGRERQLRLDTAVAGVALPMVDRERVRIRPRSR